MSMFWATVMNQNTKVLKKLDMENVKGLSWSKVHTNIPVYCLVFFPPQLSKGKALFLALWNIFLFPDEKLTPAPLWWPSASVPALSWMERSPGSRVGQYTVASPLLKQETDKRRQHRSH